MAEKKSKGKTVWSQERRKMLEHLLKQGYRVYKISETMGISVPSIYNEIRRGTTPEEYSMHQYIKYSAEASLANQISAMQRRLIGETGDE